MLLEGKDWGWSEVSSLYQHLHTGTPALDPECIQYIQLFGKPEISKRKLLVSTLDSVPKILQRQEKQGGDGDGVEEWIPGW